MTDHLRALLASAIATRRAMAGKRSFGIHDEERRLLVRHGYLLALEELEGELSQQGAFAATTFADIVSDAH
jgi:hypothetical protein